MPKLSYVAGGAAAIAVLAVGGYLFALKQVADQTGPVIEGQVANINKNLGRILKDPENRALKLEYQTVSSGLFADEGTFKLKNSAETIELPAHIDHGLATNHGTIDLLPLLLSASYEDGLRSVNFDNPKASALCDFTIATSGRQDFKVGINLPLKEDALTYTRRQAAGFGDSLTLDATVLRDNPDEARARATIKNLVTSKGALAQFDMELEGTENLDHPERNRLKLTLNNLTPFSGDTYPLSAGSFSLQPQKPSSDGTLDIGIGLSLAVPDIGSCSYQGRIGQMELEAFKKFSAAVNAGEVQSDEILPTLIKMCKGGLLTHEIDELHLVSTFRQRGQEVAFTGDAKGRLVFEVAQLLVGQSIPREADINLSLTKLNSVAEGMLAMFGIAPRLKKTADGYEGHLVIKDNHLELNGQKLF